MPAHKHADVMREYAEVAATREDPWVEFECMYEGLDWGAVGGHPAWGETVKYRRKPRTIEVKAGDTVFHLPPIILVTDDYAEVSITIFLDDEKAADKWHSFFRHIPVGQ
jgi:hypothetical protein